MTKGQNKRGKVRRLRRHLNKADLPAKASTRKLLRARHGEGIGASAYPERDDSTVESILAAWRKL